MIDVIFHISQNALVDSSWSWWIMRGILANQKRWMYDMMAKPIKNLLNGSI